MIQIRLLSGKRAGEVVVARVFPWTIGREAAAPLRLEDPGVWEQHAVLNLRLPEGVSLSARPEAMTLVNGKQVQSVQLRSGDVIELGGVKLVFGLSDARQKGLRIREAMLWIGLAALVLIELLLIRQWLP